MSEAMYESMPVWRGDLSDIVTVDVFGRGHREDGKFMTIKQLDLIEAHQDLIRDNLEADQASKLAPAEVTAVSEAVDATDTNEDESDQGLTDDEVDALLAPIHLDFDEKRLKIPSHRRSFRERIGNKSVKFAAGILAVGAAFGIAHNYSASRDSQKLAPVAATAQGDLPKNFLSLNGVHLAQANSAVIADNTPNLASPLQDAINCVPDEANVHFYGNDTPGNEFGPAVAERDIEELKAKLYSDMCVDPALLTSTAEKVGVYKLDIASRAAKIKAYMADAGLWDKDFDATVAKIQAATDFSVEKFTGQYITSYMKDLNADGIPEIVVGYEKAMTGQDVMKFTLADGTVIELKLPCHFQPVERERHVKRTTTTIIPTTVVTVPPTTEVTVPPTTVVTIPPTTVVTVPPTTVVTTPPTTTPPPTSEVPPKHDDGKLPGDGTPASQDPGTPDKAGEGPAGQHPDQNGYVPGEDKPATPPKQDAPVADDPNKHNTPVNDNPPQHEAPSAPANPGASPPNHNTHPSKPE